MHEAVTLAPDDLVAETDLPARLAARERAVAQKSLLRFITCGSVDDGKSTFIGRLLYDCQLVLTDQLAALEKDSRRYGTQGGELDFALLVDGLAAEREQGITIDVAYRYFTTGKRAFIVADTPGHEQYTRNMATGASTADLAVILVDVRNGLTAQTRRHAFIAAMLGIRHVVLAVNKMDLTGYSRERFAAVAADFTALAGKLNFASVVSIPISAKHGDNISRQAETMPWYRGPALLDHLESIDVDDRRIQAEFRLPVQWVSRPNEDFRGYCGFIASGTATPGMAVTTLPSGQRSTIKSIHLAERMLTEAGAGQSVTVTLSDSIDVSRGDVLIGSDAPATQIAHRAQAHLFWMSEVPLKRDVGYLIKLGSKTTAARVSAVHHTVDMTDYTPAAARTVAVNDLASVTVAFDSPLPLTAYRDCRELGGFILIDRLTNETVALGLIDRPLADDTPAANRFSAVTALASRLHGWLSQAREKPLRSIAKAITWRTTGSIDTFILSFLFTGDAKISAAISGSEIFTKLALYYVHERLWARSRFGLRKS